MFQEAKTFYFKECTLKGAIAALGRPIFYQNDGHHDRNPTNRVSVSMFQERNREMELRGGSVDLAYIWYHYNHITE